MLPISLQRRRRRSRCRGSTPSSGHSASASSAGERASARWPRRSPTMPQDDAGDLRSRGRRRRRRRRSAAARAALRDGDVDGAPEHARQRGAGGAGADVGQLAQCVELEVRVGGHVVPFGCSAQRSRCVAASGRGADEGVAVDDQGDVAVGEHGAAGDGGARRRAPAGSGRVTSSRWPTRWSTARARRARRPRTITAWVGVRQPAPWPSAARGVDDRQHAVAHDEHAAAGRPSGSCGRRGAACARRGRAGWRTAASRARRAART